MSIMTKTEQTGGELWRAEDAAVCHPWHTMSQLDTKLLLLARQGYIIWGATVTAGFVSQADNALSENLL